LNPLLLEIDAPLLTFILPALTVMEPAGASPPVVVEICPPSNIIRLGVLTVRAPALPVPNALAVIELGVFTMVNGPKLSDLPVCPETDSRSDAVTDIAPPCPEPKVELSITAPPAKMIVPAWTFTSPAPPGPSVEDAILVPFMVRVGVETRTGPACPKPKLTSTIWLRIFPVHELSSCKVPGRNPA
jgi:hypothetical protein